VRSFLKPAISSCTLQREKNRCGHARSIYPARAFLRESSAETLQAPARSKPARLVSSLLLPCRHEGDYWCKVRGVIFRLSVSVPGNSIAATSGTIARANETIRFPCRRSRGNLQLATSSDRYRRLAVFSANNSYFLARSVVSQQPVSLLSHWTGELSPCLVIRRPFLELEEKRGSDNRCLVTSGRLQSPIIARRVAIIVHASIRLNNPAACQRSSVIDQRTVID